MFTKFKLSTGSTLHVHRDGESIVFATVSGKGVTRWQDRISLADARELAAFLNSQVPGV